MSREQVYSIVFTRSSEKQFSALPARTKNEVALVLEDIARAPLTGKPLQGALKSLRSTRVGRFRIVYRQVKSELIIVAIHINHRKNVYKPR